MKILLKSVVAALALSASAPAFAALTLVTGGTCSTTTPNPVAAACAGAFEGNLNNENRIGDLNLALDQLFGGSFQPDVLFATLDPTKLLVSGDGDDPTGTITFQQALFGQVILSAHFGDAGTKLGDRTILYLFNFTTPTTSVALGTQGFSNAVFIAVPEPGTWAMMLMGFAAIGFAVRRQTKRHQVTIAA